MTTWRKTKTARGPSKQNSRPSKTNHILLIHQKIEFLIIMSGLCDGYLLYNPSKVQYTYTAKTCDVIKILYNHYKSCTVCYIPYQACQTWPNSGGVAEGQPRFDKGGLQYFLAIKKGLFLRILRNKKVPFSEFLCKVVKKIRI